MHDDDGRKRPEAISRRRDTIIERGRQAAREGRREDSCPYQGWQGGYREMWLRGHRQVMSGEDPKASE